MDIRVMNIGDYDGVLALWKSIKGFYIREIDDSFLGMKKFLERNPNTNVISISNNEIIGSVLCGYDGRCAYLYHVCVREDYRHKGVGKNMIDFTVDILKKEEVTHINLVAFKTNEIGNLFWHDIGWKNRDDLRLYELVLNEKNIRSLNK